MQAVTPHPESALRRIAFPKNIHRENHLISGQSDVVRANR
nr:MAG TPA: hypothetical protein [Caudoviricetes sp.]